MGERDDKWLIKNILENGCSASLNELDLRYGGIYGQIRSSYEKHIREKMYDPDFILSNSKNLIYKAATSYKPDKKASFSTWLTIVVRGHFLDSLKRERNFNKTVPGLDENIDDGTHYRSIFDNMDIFSERIRSVIIYKYQHGYTLKEIARKISCSYREAKIAHSDGLALLRDNMTQCA